jgi:integrase
MPVEARAMKDLRASLSQDRIDEMVERCEYLMDRALLRLLQKTGMRISELAKPGKHSNPVLGLRVTDILWEEHALIIRHAKRKGNPPRRIDVDKDTLDMVKEYLDKRPNKSEFVIPVGRQMAYLIVRRAAERIGIFEVGDSLISKRRHPHPHHLRHAFCTYVIKKSGGKLEDVARLQRHVGHVNISTTMSYFDISDEEQSKWYEALWEEEK